MSVDRYQDVVRAAIRVFGQYGYSAASVQDVANALNMPKGTLYHYIKSKEDLLAQIFDTSHQEMQTILGEVREFEGPALDQLRHFVERYVQWSIENIDKAKIYSREWRYLTGPLRRSVIERRVGLDQVMESLIDAAKAEGAVSPDLPTRRTAYFVWGAISSVPDWYSRNGVETPASIAASYGAFTVNVVSGPVVPAPPVLEEDLATASTG